MYLSIRLSVCLFIYRSVCVFLSFDLQYIFICTSICLSTDLSIYLFTYLSIPLSIYSCLSVYLADILSQSVIQLICLSINQAIPLSWHSSSFAVALSHSHLGSLYNLVLADIFYGRMPFLQPSLSIHPGFGASTDLSCLSHPMAKVLICLGISTDRL